MGTRGEAESGAAVEDVGGMGEKTRALAGAGRAEGSEAWDSARSGGRSA